MQSLRKTFRELLIRSKILRTELSEEDLKEVIEAGTQSGAIDKTEQELIKSILEFSSITVKEIMVPRPDIVALDIEMPRDQIIHKVIEEGYTRLPVYRGTIDTVVGVIYSKDLLSLMEYDKLIILQDIIRPPLFVPESKKISRLLREFQQNKAHLGVVVDEYGGTEGIITLEDIMEEIVGEILDEYDEIHRSVVSSSDGSALVDANLSVGDFNQQFHAAIPESPDYETLAGYLQQQSGHLPEMNEEIRTPDLAFVIVSKRGRRIRQVGVRRISHTLETEPN
jgi:CBS domain containing-hemolysin-like protein